MLFGGSFQDKNSVFVFKFPGISTLDLCLIISLAASQISRTSLNCFSSSLSILFNQNLVRFDVKEYFDSIQSVKETLPLVS